MSLSHNLAHSIVKKNISTEDVIMTLRKYKLLSILPSVLRTIKQIYSTENTLGSIVIESPFAIDKSAVESVQKIIGDTTAPHTVTINKKILAGFKARYKGKLYDGSAERIIKQLLTNHTN